MTLGFPFRSKNFCKLLWVSCKVFVLHGYDWIHGVAKSRTTTAHLWLFRDSHPSLRTLRSAVIKSPKFSARGTASPVRFLQGAHVFLVRLQTSQFSSSGSEYEYDASLGSLSWDVSNLNLEKCVRVCAWCWHFCIFVMKNMLIFLGRRSVHSFPCCIVLSAVWNKVRLLITSPLIGISVIFAESSRTAGVSSRICTVTNESRSWTYAVASSFVCTSPLAVITAVGFLDTRIVSSSTEFRSFLLRMCIEAPESTTNSPSSGVVKDGAGRHQSSESDKNATLHFSLSLRILLAISHATLLAHRSCFKVSSSDLSSNFGALEPRSWQPVSVFFFVFYWVVRRKHVAP